MLAGEGGQHEMARPFSVDLRERVVAAVVKGGLSRRRVASQFGVGISTVISWVRRYGETGSVAPGRMGGNRPPKIVDEHRAWLVARIEEKDFTLRGLVAELAERGLKVDYRTMWKFVHAEDLSFKKNRARQRAGSPRRRPPAGAVGKVSEPH
jgi:putative transposase